MAAAAAGSVPAEDAAVQDIIVDWAEHWGEKMGLIRWCLKNKRLLKWPSPETVGVASMRALALNHVVLEAVGESWCHQHAAKRTLTVGDSRVQVGFGSICCFCLFVCLFV
jgi:hypothetical protein